MAVKERTLRQYEAIRKEYARLSAIREHGVQKYSYSWIIRRLAATFYKSPATIERIIYHQL